MYRDFESMDRRGRNYTFKDVMMMVIYLLLSVIFTVFTVISNWQEVRNKNPFASKIEIAIECVIGN